VKIVKYVIVLLLFAAAFLVTGERFVYHLAHFEDTYYGITFEYDLYGQPDTRSLVREKIQDALTESSLDVFRVDTQYLSDYKEVKTIYGTLGALEALSRRGIVPQTYNSSFIGEVEIIFRDFSEIENIYESDMFYIVGTLERAAVFKNVSAAEAGAYYGVKDVRTVLSGSESGIYATLAFAWGAVFVLTLLLTLYDVILSKKEMTVKLTLGENPYRAFMMNALLDAAVFSALFFGLSMALGVLSNVRYKFAMTSCMFAAMLAVNTLVNFLLTRVTLKKDFSNAIGGSGALRAAYAVKCVSILAASLILASNALIIAESIDYFNQEEFFLRQQSHSYYTINYSMTTRQNNILRKSDEELWAEFDNSFGSSSIRLVDISESYSRSTVLLNKNAVEIILPHISADLALKLKSASEEKLYMFFPERYGDANSVTADISMATVTFLHDKQGNENDYREVITYEGESDILGIHKQRHLLRSSFLRNPIVIIDNTRHTDAESYLNPLYIAYDVLYDIPKEDFEMFIANNGLQNEIVKVTDAKELYRHNRSTVERNAKLMTAVSVFLLLLETAMVVFVIRLEYTINGIEMVIKKTLGYGIFGRSKRLILLTAALIPLCTVSAIVAAALLNIGNTIFVAASGCILLVAELIFVAAQCARMDKIKTALILKGAKL
jgi:hypothetical protein